MGNFGTRINRPEVFERRKVSNNATSHQSFPAQPHPHGMLMVFNQYDYSNFANGFNSRGATRVTAGGRASGVSLKTRNSIELPFPKNLTDQTDLRINGFERDPFTEAVANKINDYANGSGGSMADVPSMLQGMGSDMASALTGDMMTGLANVSQKILGTNMSDIASGAQYLLRNKLSGDISKSIDLVTGQTINPRETLAFEGVNLRSHSFNWELFPSNQTDSERIRNIVNMIKRNSLPEVKDLAGIPKAFLQYPATVDIYLIGVNEDHYIKFKTSMVTAFSVDYGAGGGVAIMKGGKPAGVSIQMSLTELEIQTAHDFGAVGNPEQNAISVSTGDEAP